MRRILGNVLGYGTMGVVCLSVVIIIAALLGFMCWLTLTKYVSCLFIYGAI